MSTASISEYGNPATTCPRADVAMYRGKDRAGGGRSRFSTSTGWEVAGGRLDLDTALHHVIERGE